MRILHTSDWHLGRGFGSVSLAAFQEQFVDWLVEVCRDEQVDLVVIAGDVFDRAIAPVESVTLFREALPRLRATGALVAVITGNHDGADRVASYGDLLDLSGVYLRGGYLALGEVLTVSAADGPLDLVLLPFLDPQAAPDSLAHDSHASDDAAPGDTGPDDAGRTAGAPDDAVTRLLRRTHQSVLATAVAAVRPRLSATRSLAVAHAYVDGGVSSDSERQLVVGGTGAVSADIFTGFSYTALGHLHRPQAVGQHHTVRYSGTPLAYSFSEDHAKSVTLIDMSADGTCDVREMPVPVGRRVHQVIGTIDDLLASQPGRDIADRFVKAIITDAGLVSEPKQRLQAVFPHLVEIELRPQIPADGPSDIAPREIARLTPAEAVLGFWQAARGVEAPADVTRLFHEALAAVSGEGDL